MTCGGPRQARIGSSTVSSPGRQQQTVRRNAAAPGDDYIARWYRSRLIAFEPKVVPARHKASVTQRQTNPPATTPQITFETSWPIDRGRASSLQDNVAPLTPAAAASPPLSKPPHNRHRDQILPALRPVP